MQNNGELQRKPCGKIMMTSLTLDGQKIMEIFTLLSSETQVTLCLQIKPDNHGSCLMTILKIDFINFLFVLTFPILFLALVLLLISITNWFKVLIYFHIFLFFFWFWWLFLPNSIPMHSMLKRKRIQQQNNSATNLHLPITHFQFKSTQKYSDMS